MKNLLLGLCLIAGISAYPQQVAKSLTSSSGLFIGFYEYTPVDYNVDLTKKYPLIIFLHGIGERGNGTTELSRVLANAIPKYINAGCQMRFTSLSGVQETFLVLCPQLSSIYGSWQNAYVDEMLKYAKQNLRVDTNRIFLTGLSLGGGGTWKYSTASLANAKQFAAIAAVCGTCDWTNMCNLASANLPVWAFHAQDDGTVGVGCTNGAISSMLTCNPAVLPLKTIYANGNHWIWDRAYDTVYNWQNPNVFEWFLGQSRLLPVNSLPVANAGADKTITLPLSDVSLNGGGSTDADGIIARYIWKIIQTPGGGWIENAAANNTLAHSLIQGVYKFELTVIDDRAGSSKDTVTITVNPTSANIPPVAEAGKDSIVLALTVNIDASSSYDPDGFVAAYKWRQVSGPSTAIITCSTCAAANMTNLANGTYKMEVEVTDNIGAKTTDTVQISEVGSALPTDILYFKGKNLGQNSILQWATGSEFNNDHFELQRSIDGRTYETITSIAGAGTSALTREYNYTDQNVPDKSCFYRLMLVDKDGSFKYSSIVRLNSNQGKWYVETFPNPVVEELLIQVNTSEKGAMDVRLISQQGQLIRDQHLQKHADLAEMRMNTKQLAAGIYFVEIRMGDVIREVRKIIKE